jgi:hypothetical protein
MNQYFDHKKLNSFESIKTARAMLRYSIVVQEQMLLESFNNMRKNVIGSLKQSAWRLGIKIVTGFLVSQITSWRSNKG